MTELLSTARDRAMVMCCDQRFIPYALFVCWQVAMHCPFRSFDIIIVTQDDLVLPDWALALGITVHRIGEMDPAAEAARFKGSLAPMMRLMLAKELGHRYRRLLYLDGDIHFDGGDLDRLMQIDMGPHAIAAVRDLMILHNPNYHHGDMKAMGLPKFNYFNSGVMVIDTKAFIEQKVAERGWAVAEKHPLALELADQSIFNGVLQGSYAELAPCWNWCSSYVIPMFTWTYPANFVHFIGSTKPFFPNKKPLDARFRKAYADFFRNYMPEMEATLPPPRDATPISLSKASQYFLLHLKGLKHVPSGLARFKDAWDVKL